MTDRQARLLLAPLVIACGLATAWVLWLLGFSLWEALALVISVLVLRRLLMGGRKS